MATKRHVNILTRGSSEHLLLAASHAFGPLLLRDRHAYFTGPRQTVINLKRRWVGWLFSAQTRHTVQIIFGETTIPPDIHAIATGFLTPWDFNQLEKATRRVSAHRTSIAQESYTKGLVQLDVSSWGLKSWAAAILAFYGASATMASVIKFASERFV